MSSLLLKKFNQTFLETSGTAKTLKRYISRIPIDQIVKKTDFVRSNIPTIYGGKHLVTMIAGSGIGPEMMKHVRDVFKYLKAPVDFELIENIEDESDVKNMLTSVLRNGVCIKGSIKEIDLYEDYRLSLPNVALRRHLDLYVCVNICKSYKNIGRFRDMDIVIIRQNTEGEYCLLDHEIMPGVAQSLKIITAENTERLMKWAIDFAKLNGRKKITIVHSSLKFEKSSSLFLKVAKQVAIQHPEINVEDMAVGKCIARLVTDPQRFDILITPGLYGSIFCNTCCGLLGGPGLIPGCNYGDYYAVFETASRSMGTDLVGKGTFNPIAILNASADMLYHLGHTDYAVLIEEAIMKTVEKNRVLTVDVGGTSTTAEVIENILHNIDKGKL